MEISQKIQVKIVSDRYDNTAPLMNALDPSTPIGTKHGELEHERTEMTTEAEL